MPAHSETIAEKKERIPRHRDTAELETGLPHVLDSPKEEGPIMLMLCRPEVGERRVLERLELDVELGVVGDNWSLRGSSKTADGGAHPEMQLNLMNARVIEQVAGEREFWPLAGDQFFVDLDLGRNNLPPGTRLGLGSAEIEVTPVPHLGCKKFVARFGIDAMKFVNSGPAKEQCLRGINARVIRGGVVHTGDMLRKLS